MLRCTSCKKTQPESEFKKFNETLSKTCIQCLSKRKKKHVIGKISQTQLGENSSEYQNIQTNTTSAKQMTSKTPEKSISMNCPS